MRGFQISPALTDLFGFARDETGLMVAADSAEMPWLEHLPFSAAVHQYGSRTSLLLVTAETAVMDLTIPPTGIELHVPLTRQPELTNETLIGFCLVKDGRPRRVGRIVRLYTPESFAVMRSSQSSSRERSGGLFSGI